VNNTTAQISPDVLDTVPPGSHSRSQGQSQRRHDSVK